MKRLLIIAAALLASGAAHAEQWYYVNFDNGPGGSQNGCVAVPEGRDPAGSIAAVIGHQTIQTDRDMTLADGSRLMILSVNDQKYAYATTVKTCLALRDEIARQSASAAAGRDKWYVAQYRGDCVELSSEFSGVSTPAELHKAMTRNGSHLSLDRRGDDIALLTDDFGHYPPLVMVHGLARCQSSDAAQLASQ